MARHVLNGLPTANLLLVDDVRDAGAFARLDVAGDVQPGSPDTMMSTARPLPWSALSPARYPPKDLTGPPGTGAHRAVHGPAFINIQVGSMLVLMGHGAFQGCRPRRCSACGADFVFDRNVERTQPARSSTSEHVSRSS